MIPRGIAWLTSSVRPDLALLLISLLILVACGGGSGTPGRVLRVQITGLPAGTAAMVRVIGEDQSERTVTGDTDLKVPPGKYIVRGLAVGGGAKDAPVYAPSVASQDVTISSSAGATVKVEYGLLQTKISPETKVADDAASSSLTSLVRGSDGRATLTFAGGNLQIAALKAGEILVLGSSAAAPEGFFGRVVSNDGTTVETEPAAMQEVVEQGAFVYQQTLKIDDGVGPLPQGVQPSAVGGCLNMNRTIGAKAGTGGVAAGLKVTVSGTLCVSLDVSLNITFNPPKLVKGKIVVTPPSVDFKSTVRTDGTNLKASASALVGTPYGAAPFEFPEIAIPVLPDYRFPSFTIMTGPIPWVVVPTLSVSIGAGGTVTAGVKFGVVSNGQAQGGFSYDGNNNQANALSSSTLSFAPEWPTFTSTLNLKAFLEPSLAFLIDGAAGPFVGLQPYVRFQADFGPPIDWQLYAGIGISTGLDTAFKGVPPLSVSPYNYEAQVLSSRTATPSPGQTTGNAPNYDASGGVVVGPDDTVYAGSGSSVRAFPNALAPNWAYNTSSSVLGLSRGDDGTIYAWDFGGTLYAIKPDGTEKWKVGPLGALEIRRAALTADGLVVTAGGNTVRAFQASDGALRWSDDVGEGVYSVAVDKSGNIWSNGDSSVRKHAPTGGVQATVAAPSSPGGMAMAPDGTIYVRTISNGVIQVSAVSPNATLKWSKSLSNTSTGRAQADSLSEPAVGPDGTVYICGTPTDPNFTGGLFAVSPAAPAAATEAPKWIYTHHELCKATPAVGDNGQVFILTDKALRAVNASDGTLAWSVAAGNNDTVSSPLFLKNKTVVAGTSQGVVSVYAGGSLAAGTWAREGGDANSSGRMR
ncbi:MAG: hypothetical protein C4331_08155 [Meiothermus sp.]